MKTKYSLLSSFCIACVLSVLLVRIAALIFIPTNSNAAKPPINVPSGASQDWISVLIWALG